MLPSTESTEIVSRNSFLIPGRTELAEKTSYRNEKPSHERLPSTRRQITGNKRRWLQKGHAWKSQNAARRGNHHKPEGRHSLTPEITESLRLEETSEIIKSKLNTTASTKPYSEGIRYLERNASPSAHRGAAEKFSMDPNLVLPQFYHKLKPWHSA